MTPANQPRELTLKPQMTASTDRATPENKSKFLSKDTVYDSAYKCG